MGTKQRFLIALKCKGSSDISLFLSEDGGVSFKEVNHGLSGDIGGEIISGSKLISWNIPQQQGVLIGDNILLQVKGVINKKFGKLIDNRDGQSYLTVNIGNQTVMAENLRYRPNGGQFWEYYIYKLDISTDFGYYYDYNTAKNVCPIGWHLPSKMEFNNLLESIGGEGKNAYNALLPSGYTGFHALMGGHMMGCGGNFFYDKENLACFWSSTKTNSSDNLLGYVFIYELKMNVLQRTASVDYAFCNDEGASVRCFKDNFTNELNSNYESFYGNSKILSFNIITDLNEYIKKYVEHNILIWQKKNEFEKTIDYQKRVNEQTRNLKIQQFTDDAVKKLKSWYLKSISWDLCQLSDYDADDETFLIKSLQLNDFAISVPAIDAKLFKEKWKSFIVTNTDFFINNNKLVLAKVTFKNPLSNKMYTYDSKQPTTYSASNITYNFNPIEVDVKQDNLVNNTKVNEKKTTVGLSDVDVNIPQSAIISDKSFAVIIANENYNREVKVQYASNDGKIFKEYCLKTLGIPEKNIQFVQDATFGTIKSEIKWISDVASAFNGQAKIIFYYAGHGMPNESDKSAYLLPVDGFSSDYETAIKLDDLYNRLNANSSKSITVFLDACFSGSIRDNGMLANVRGVRIRPKNNIIKGNIIVFSATTGDETAYPYKENQHGLFTYFLLKKLQETKGDVNYESLSNYIIENVKQQSIVVNQKSQTPQVNTSIEVQNTWQTMKLK